MKKLLTATILIVFAIAMSLTGCTTPATKATPLTQEELDYFNGTLFFNREYENNVIDSINIRNQFLSSTYDSPEDINLFELFYCGSGTEEPISDEEFLALGGASYEVDCTKISVEAMNAVLQDNMALTIEETNQIGLEQFAFLEEYNSYYHFHGDTNYRVNISFHSGERQDDTIRLYYNDEFFGDGEKILTMRQNNGAYLFVSNQNQE